MILMSKNEVNFWPSKGYAIDGSSNFQHLTQLGTDKNVEHAKYVYV